MPLALPPNVPISNAKRQFSHSKSEAEITKMHRVVRPTKAFIPRQRHAAEGGCSTWGHRTAASAKCSLLHQMRAAENAGCSWLSERCCANGALQGGVQRLQAERNAAGCGCGFAALLGDSCCANGARRAECSAFRQSEMQLRADAGLLHESNRQRMRAVAVPRKAKLRAKIMHRVVRPPIAFTPRQRHVAEGGCTTWGHRTAASAKCSCVRMQACCTRCNRLRMRAVAVTAKAWFRKRSPSRRSAALSC